MLMVLDEELEDSGQTTAVPESPCSSRRLFKPTKTLRKETHIMLMEEVQIMSAPLAITCPGYNPAYPFLLSVVLSFC
jgi:hypothetical protein